MTAVQRIGVLAVPWLFTIAFALVWWLVLVPRALEGHAALICICLLAALSLLTFAAASATFSRDVLQGRWPQK